jgi:hypothetical protein
VAHFEFVQDLTVQAHRLNLHYLSRNADFDEILNADRLLGRGGIGLPVQTGLPAALLKAAP